MANLRSPRMILIDVDGTLVDSVPDLAYCVDELMKALGRPVHGETKVRNWVGNGVERLVRRALIGQLDGEPPDEDYARAYPIFLELYAENTSKRSRLYPGIREGIDWLKSQGYLLGCVTNKAAQFTLPLLEDLGVRDEFGIVVWGDTLPVKKPDPAPLHHAARYLKCYSAVSMPSLSLKGFALWPNRLSRLGHKQKIPLRPLRLRGEPDFETKQIHPKTPMKSRDLTSDFSYPGQQ